MTDSPPAGADTLVVTISSSYGAGGSVVAPDVAARLGLPFVDRAVPPSAIQAIECEEGLAPDERGDSLLQRLVTSAARMPALIGVTMPEPSFDISDEERFKAENEAGMRNLLETTGGVIRGRGGAAFLGRDPRCFHVRLDGPVESRIRQAMRIEGIDEETATRRQAQTDQARSLYIHRFYERDVHDPTMYHLILDSTVVPLPVGADLIAQAARATLAGRGDSPAADKAPGVSPS